MQWFASVGVVLALGVGAAAANTPAAVIQPRPSTAGTQGTAVTAVTQGRALTALAPGTAVSRWVWPCRCATNPPSPHDRPALSGGCLLYTSPSPRD